MDRKLAHKIIKSPYLWTGILVFALLTIFSLQKEKQIEKKAIKQIENMAKSISRDNINIFKNIIGTYYTQLEYVKFSLQSGLSIEQVRQYLRQNDSILATVDEVELPYQLLDKRTKACIPASNPYIEILLPISVSANKTRAIRLELPLIYLHARISEDKGFSYAYLTLIHDGKYLFHPDETKIGKRIEASTQKTLEQNKEKEIVETFSDFLGIPIYQYEETTIIDEEKWTFTANVPRISFKELTSDTRSAFISVMLWAYAAFIFIFLLGFLYWQREFLKTQQLQKQKINLELKNEQQTKQALANELEHLKSGLNPHFLFNSLSSLSILVNKNATQAQHFASALSNLYRYLLRHEKSERVSLEEEMKFTKDYIYLQQIRFNDLIRVQIAIPQPLLNRHIPPVSIQLLVENCIKHTKMSQKTPLHIKIYSDSDFIIVSNNYNPPERMHTSGKGLDNLTKRYSLLTSASCSFSVVGEEFVAKIPLLAHAY